MSELKLCSYCKSVPQANTWTLHGISETRYFCPNPECPHSVRTVTLEEWNTRPIEDALNKRIAELEGIIKSDDERLTEAGLKVNLYFGCDTAEIMAEEILSSRARIAELEGDNDALKTENAELKERIGFLEINAIVYSSGQMGYIARIAELEAERDCLAEKVADLEFRMDIYNSDSYEIIVAENKRYLARIAGLEGLIDQLIEIGKGLDDGYEHYRFSEQTIPLMKLRKLTADWKEREE